jgi:hypothetical protein
MSNCIYFGGRTGIIALTSSEFDTQNFQRFLSTVPFNGEEPKEGHAYHAWWFLNNNINFPTPNLLIIRLGEGRSTHTFRDLRGTLYTLTRYYRPNTQKTYNFYLYDTDAPWDGWFRVITQKTDNPLTSVIFPGDKDTQEAINRAQRMILKVTPIPAPE